MRTTFGRKTPKQKARDERMLEQKRIERARRKMEANAKMEAGRIKKRIIAQQMAEKKNRRHASVAYEEMQAVNG